MMFAPKKTASLLHMFALLVCSSFVLLTGASAQENAGADYTFETIEVPGVDFLSLTASSDFEDYAGYTLNADGKEVAFTLIDGNFKTYDFPGSQSTRFFALGNNGNAAGYYVDSEGLHKGVVLLNGELQSYDFPNSVQTEIYGISDATGALTGNFTDADGIRRGFSGEKIIEYPGALETFSDFVNARGLLVGSYVDADGIYHAYGLLPNGRFVPINLEDAATLEYFFVHGINDAGAIVARAKRTGAVPLTYIGSASEGLQEFKVPGSVSTEGYNINQDGSIVGHYESEDGRRYGFIAKPAEDDDPIDRPDVLAYTFESIDVPGVDYLALTASSDFEDYAGYAKSADGEKMVAFTLMDGVFKTYDFPGSKNTYFYALANNGTAAGYYEDSDGLSRGVLLVNGELHSFDYPNSVETEIYGISDVTGALTGNFTDASGVRRGFSGETIVEVPGALATYADYVNASGRIVGGYIDADGIPHAYVRTPDNRFVTIDVDNPEDQEYHFLHGISNAGIFIGRAKAVDGAPITYVGTALQGDTELHFPGSVSTNGWNINQDGSVVGYYDTADGRRRGFVARLAGDAPEPPPADDNYTYEPIYVPGVDFLSVTSSSDFEDYAGYTLNADGKEVAFTLIDGDFKTYDFPGSQSTRFFALGNNGNAAGYYVDSEGRHKGVVLLNGALQPYDFPNSVQTEIWGISDSTGALTGNFIDASGIRRGFSGQEIIEYPGAAETYADFVNSNGGMVGSYVNADGVYYPYIRTPTGRFTSVELARAAFLEYFFVHGINDARTVVARTKPKGGVPQTYVGTFQGGLEPFKVPGSASTEGYNINQDGSIVGHYDSADGKRYGFIAKPIDDAEPPVPTPSEFHFVFETIDVPGVEYLELTASSDFEDYAGNTKSADGKKTIAFTLIDGVFKTYDFPGSKNTYFYALGNNGRAAGHYEDSEGRHHGVVLVNGNLHPFDFPNSVETEIYGISDATGALTGNFTDAAGIRRGFTGQRVIQVPGAPQTYADFVNASGRLVGSYVDADGVYHPYSVTAAGRFTLLELPSAEAFEYYFIHGINDIGVLVGRAKKFDDVPTTYVGSLQHGLHKLRFPGSVSTEGWNINQDGSIVGNYVSQDGRRHGFIAKPVDKEVSDAYSNAYTVRLTKGLNMISVPLKPSAPMNAKALAGLTGSTTVIRLDEAKQRFVGWTPAAPNDGFDIEGGKGYIVNVPTTRQFAFAGAAWTDPVETAQGAPPLFIETPQETWAFVVSGHLESKRALDGYRVVVRNRRTNETFSASVQNGYFAAATADLSRRSVVEMGDAMELRVVGPDGNIESQTFRFDVTSEHLANAVLPVTLYGIGMPSQSRLLPNYPNPFNPETWIPYQLAEDSEVSIEIYDSSGRLIRSLSLGYQSAGFYNSRGRAAYWDGRNAVGEQVASGVYFYQLKTPSFRQTRRLLILK